MITAAAWAATLTVLAGGAACARTALRGHQESPGRLACLRRAAACRAAKAVLVTAIWAVTTAITWTGRGRT